MKSRYIASIIGFILIFIIQTGKASTPSLPDPLAAGWNGSSVCELLKEDDKQRILRCTFPPGVGHERHFHAANFGYTVSGGKMKITDVSGSREVNIPSGSYFPTKAIEWHEVINIGETTFIYLIVEQK